MSNILITYFSASGVTARTANTIRELTGGDIYEIKPAAIYTKEDLDWRNKSSRSSVEMSNPNARPELADRNAEQQVTMSFLSDSLSGGIQLQG